MDFSWTAKQLALRDKYADFARQELSDGVVNDDAGSVFPREKWNRCAEFGLLRLGVPSEYSGDGLDITTAVLAMEGVGHGCRDNGLAFAINGQLLIRMPILQFGTERQKEVYLPAMCCGQSMGAFAFTEPDFGSDLYGVRTRAEKQDGGYVLNGVKKFVTFAPIADFALVLATVDPDLGNWGLTVFLVDTKTPGFQAGPPQDKMGLRTVPFGEIILDNCHVPEDCRLGKEGSGMNILNYSLTWDRCCILASQLGAMQRQLEECVQYTRTRHQFGQPIGKFQSVSNRIVDMKMRLETARLLLYKTAWLMDSGKTAVIESALAKLHLSECFVQSSLDAIRIHGGNGYLSEMEVERQLRDAIGGTIYGGTSDIQRNTIAKMLGL